MNYVNLKVKFSNPFCFLFICLNMSKTLSGKCYQENKERLQKAAHERYQNLSKEEKEKLIK